ncbi:hypothetical protein CGGC5_v017161 [Colletotrichum fructicola Nara gc5]|uniref:Ankyrin repeat protein n=1 Tax=Colletotrichum fructicola (strain Nara gc5) TaxID=1213859 RepID=A0A7J6IFH9_COLFN|nr:hypothetical protein CGGC5_v017161 [Colletotrichum fructicola Nara gc5]
MNFPLIIVTPPTPTGLVATSETIPPTDSTPPSHNAYLPNRKCFQPTFGASTLLDEHSSHSLIRALFLGDLASAEEHFAYSVPVPGIPAMQGLLEHPDMDLNRTTNSKYGDGIIHFLLRASVGRFVDNKVETIKLCMRHGVNLTQQGAQGDTILHLLCGPLDYVCSFSEEEYNLSLLRFLFEERRDDAQLRVGVDFRNDYGNTPLMVAVLYGFSGARWNR